MSDQQEVLTIDAALSSPLDIIGAAIERSGQEDSSGYRRQILWEIVNGEIASVSSWLGIPLEESMQLANDVASAIENCRTSLIKTAESLHDATERFVREMEGEQQ